MNRRKTTKINREKHAKKNRIRIFISNFLLLIIILIISFTVYGVTKENKIKILEKESNEENIEIESKENMGRDINKSVKKIIVPDIEVEENYMGYEVSCRLEIPKIKLYTNVLSKYSELGLKECISKYYGPDANEIGNYCIAGHNYQKENMFNHLIDLNLEDVIYLIDNKNGVVEYKVYDIYKVTPENTKPLSQKTDGKRELTLITCVNYSKNRLIIKAVEHL